MPKLKDGSTQFTLYMSDELLNEVKKKAKQSEQTIASYIRSAIIEYLKK